MRLSLFDSSAFFKLVLSDQNEMIQCVMASKHGNKYSTLDNILSIIHLLRMTLNGLFLLQIVKHTQKFNCRRKMERSILLKIMVIGCILVVSFL